MKDNWGDLFESKSFILSVIASLFTVLLISFYEIIDTIIPNDNKVYFKATFTLIIIVLIGWYLSKLKRLKDAEFEILKSSTKNKK